MTTANQFAVKVYGNLKRLSLNRHKPLNSVMQSFFEKIVTSSSHEPLFYSHS